MSAGSGYLSAGSASVAVEPLRCLPCAARFLKVVASVASISLFRRLIIRMYRGAGAQARAGRAIGKTGATGALKCLNPLRHKGLVGSVCTRYRGATGNQTGKQPSTRSFLQVRR